MGTVNRIDNDGSLYGNGNASGLQSIAVNAGGSIDFRVSGYPDLGFMGNHNQAGMYRAYVEVRNATGTTVLASFDEARAMTQGVMEVFHYLDASWATGRYSINIDNTLGDFDHDGDVDGRDFLFWQQVEPEFRYLFPLEEWQANYGLHGEHSHIATIPEPGGLFYIALVVLTTQGRNGGCLNSGGGRQPPNNY